MNDESDTNSPKDNTLSRRALLRGFGAILVAPILSPLEAAAQTLSKIDAEKRPTDEVLILSNKKGEIKPITINLLTGGDVPAGWEWAKEPIKDIVAGAKKIRENESKFLGKNAMFEGFIKSGGAMLLSEDGKFNGEPLAGDSEFSILPADKRNIPTIAFNAKQLNAVPDNAAFLEAHELGHFYNYAPNLFRAKTVDEIKALGDKVMVHSGTPLFGFALNTDFCDLQTQKKTNSSLIEFTANRIANPNETADQTLRDSEQLADAVGYYLSGTHPKFPWNATFSQQKPMVSPLVERYVKDVFLLDVGLRNDPSPTARNKLVKLYETLSSGEKAMGTQAAYEEMGKLEEKLVGQVSDGKIPSDADVARAKALVSSGLDIFSKMKKEQFPEKGK